MEEKPIYLLIVFLLTALAGTALHFLYATFPNPLTALLAPVNESLWEHGKLLFWPVVVVLFLLRPAHPATWLAGLLLAVALMQGLGYLYHITLQQDALWVDIALYFLTLGLVFLVPLVFQPLPGEPVLFLATLALGLAFVLFSFFPPQALLFQDLSTVHTWFTIPY